MIAVIALFHAYVLFICKLQNSGTSGPVGMGKGGDSPSLHEMENSEEDFEEA